MPKQNAKKDEAEKTEGADAEHRETMNYIWFARGANIALDKALPNRNKEEWNKFISDAYDDFRAKQSEELEKSEGE